MAKLILNGNTPKVYVNIPQDLSYEKRNGSCFETRTEGSTTIAPNNRDQLVFSYTSGSALGTVAYYKIKLDKTVYKKVKIKITTGSTAYTNYSQETYWAVCGIRSGANNNYIGYTSNNWLVKEGISQLNHDYEFEFDLDDINDNNPYFYVAGGGWNMTVTEWGLVTR